MMWKILHRHHALLVFVAGCLINYKASGQFDRHLEKNCRTSAPKYIYKLRNNIYNLIFIIVFLLLLWCL